MPDVTAIARRESTGVLDATTSEGWALVGRKAEALAGSTIVPEAYRGKPQNCLIAMDMAHRMGLPALTVMQNLHIVQGNPTWAAQFLIACINSCGRFSPVRFEFKSAEGSDDWGCRVVATSLEDDEVLPGEWITIAMAKAEGWYGRNGSKWKTMPGQMLRYRSAAFWARAYAPELAVGLHTADEAEDIGPSPAKRAAAIAQALDAESEVIEGEIVEDGNGAGGNGEGDDLKPIRDELYELMGTSAPHLFNDQEARRKWVHRQVGKTTAKGCSEYELRQLIAAIQKGDTDPETPAEEGAPATSTPFDDENELPA